MMNFTVTVPPHAQNHGDPGLICLPPKWTDYIIFFGTNYFAHAGSLISHPGESFQEILISTANALFIPGSGALRAFRFLVLYISPLLSEPGHAGSLRQAARAGALCMIVEEKDISDATKDEGPLHFIFGKNVIFVPPARAIHGICRIPRYGRGIPKYRLIEVPSGMPLQLYGPPVQVHAGGSSSSDLESTFSGPEPAPPDMTLAKNYNPSKVLISILNIVWGITTLYETRGDQIALYGYGAFSLTVAPYAIMSIINLATNLLRPEYATMYLVHSPDMDTAQEHGGEFRGVVASIDIPAINAGGFDVGGLTPEMFYYLNILGYLVICILPLGLVGGFTGFQSGQNVNIGISWVLGWLIIGSVSSLWVRISASFWLHPIWEIILVLPLWIPAIGGFVVVAQMLSDFGICTTFD